jgi:hypothetical protein
MLRTQRSAGRLLWTVTFTAATYNMVRMRRLLAVALCRYPARPRPVRDANRPCERRLTPVPTRRCQSLALHSLLLQQSVSGTPCRFATTRFDVPMDAALPQAT